MNSKFTAALIVMFVLAVSVSLAGGVLINGTLENGRSTKVAAANPGEVDILKTEIAGLRAEIDSLKAKFDERIYAAGSPDRPGKVASRGNPTGEDLPALPPLAKPDSPAAKEYLDRLVDKRLEERQKEREEERRKNWEDRRKRWTEQYVEGLTETYNERVEKMKKELDLSDSQIIEVSAVFDERKESLIKMREERHDADIPDDEKVNWEDVNKKFQEEMKEILSQDQLKIYEEKKLGSFSGRRGRGMRGWGGRGRRGGR